jgi:hypothetical protein
MWFEPLILYAIIREFCSFKCVVVIEHAVVLSASVILSLSKDLVVMLRALTLQRFTRISR